MAETRRKAGGNSTEENGPPQKRQRVSRACDQCRSAREKCDGIQPACFTCASSNRTCSYTTNPKKRGIQPGYIRTLELILAWVFSNVSGSEEALRSTLDGGPGQLILTGKDAEGSYNLHRRWRKSLVCREIDRLLSGSEEAPTAAVTSPPSPGLSELQSTVRFTAEASVPAQSPLAPDQSGPPMAAPQAGGDVQRIFTIDTSTMHPASPQYTKQNQTSLQLPPNLWRLIDVYFAYTHCWFPIIEKQDVLKTSYSYSDDVGVEVSANSPDSGSHAELWAVLAVAAHQEVESASYTVSPENIRGTRSDYQPAQDPGDIYTIARKLVPGEHGSYHLGHVKALLLLSLVNLSNQYTTAAWVLIGAAVRIACLILQVKIDSSDGSAAMNRWTAREKHVYLGCFVLDTLVSAQLGKMPYLRRDQIGQVGLIDEDGLEEWHPWLGCEGFGSNKNRTRPQIRSPVHTLSTFNQMVRVVVLLNDAASQRAATSLGRQQAVLELQRWISSLPGTCDLLKLSRHQSAPTPPLLNLHLAYLCTVIACGAQSEQAEYSSQVLDVLERYADACGMTVIPPLFHIYTAMARRHISSDGLGAACLSRLTRLESAFTEASRTWRPKEAATPLQKNLNDSRFELDGLWNSRSVTAVSSNVGPTISSFGQASSPSFHQTNTGIPVRSITTLGVFEPSDQINRGQPALTRSPYMETIPDIGQAKTLSTSQPTRPLRSLSFNAAVNTPPESRDADVSGELGVNMSTPYGGDLERYNSVASTDLDALFDEMAPLDGAERSDAQPQFMQNLGFAPDANLVDVFASDYGQIDPLFSMYMQNGILGTPALNQNQSFNGG